MSSLFYNTGQIQIFTTFSYCHIDASDTNKELALLLDQVKKYTAENANIIEPATVLKVPLKQKVKISSIWAFFLYYKSILFFSQSCLHIPQHSKRKEWAQVCDTQSTTQPPSPWSKLEWPSVLPQFFYIFVILTKHSKKKLYCPLNTMRSSVNENQRFCRSLAGSHTLITSIPAKLGEKIHGNNYNYWGYMWQNYMIWLSGMLSWRAPVNMTTCCSLTCT